MSFADYSNKKKKKQTQALGQASNFIEWSDAQHGTHFADLYEKDEEDIAPVKGGNADSWFKSGGFSDGSDDFFDFLGNLGETVVGTTMDLGIGVIKGAGRVAEGLVDLGTYGAAGVADLFGADDFAEDAKNIAKTDYVTKLTQNATKSVDQYSVLGNKMDMVSEGIGQVGALVLTGGLGKLGGLGTVGNTILTTGTMGLSGVGSGMSEAYNAGASDGEAFTYGLISGVAEAGTELMFGGLGKASNAIGLGKSAIPLDDFLAKSVTKNMTSRVAKNLTQYGIKASAEGVEEVIAGYISAHAKKGTYMSDVDFDEILENENLLEQFIVGAVTSGISQSGYIPGMKNGSLRESIKTDRDFITGYTNSEQTVIDKAVEKRVAEAEKNGKKLTKREIGEIEEKVKSDLEKGYISIDEIEETLGGDSYTAYKNSFDQDTARQNELDAMKKEYDVLYNMKNGEKSNAQIDREAELKKQIEGFKLDSNTDSLKAKLSEEVFNLVKDGKLAESYNEKARKGQAFQADLSKYKGRQREAIERAIKSGVLNNTNRSHELVDILSKIEADKGIVFDYADNAKLKESGFAVEGKTVNGFEKNGTVTLNVQSAKAWESTVGHEIGHVLEGTEAYSALRESLYKYAKSKGELESRRANLTELYKDMDADIDAELTADLLGDYLFNDGKFIKDLTANRNLFQKIYDEIKYLCKIATGKQLTDIEKVKQEFDKAWKEVSEKGIDKVVKNKEAKTNTNIMSREEYDMWRIEELNRLNPQLSNTIKGEIVDSTHLDGESTDGMQGMVGSHYGSTIRRTKDAKVGTFTHEILHTVDMLSGNNVRGYVEDLANGKGFDNYDTLLNYLKSAREQGKVDGRTTNAEETAQMVLHAFYSDRDGLRSAAPEFCAYLEDMGLDKYSHLTKNYEQYKASAESGKVKYSVSEDSEGNQLSKGQQEYFKDSKVVDENGNLKVMYHGSPNAGFHEFDTQFSDDKMSFFFVDSNDMAESYSGTNEEYIAKTFNTAEDFNNFFAEIGAEDYEVIEESGKFVLLDDGDEVATSDTAKGLYDEFTDYTGLGHGAANYKTYLNITNPLVVDVQGKDWNRLPDPREASGETGLTEEFGFEMFTTRDYAEYAKENGYDGVIFKNIYDKGGYASENKSSTVAIAFESNQIKSVANANPTSNKDIRYSLSSMANTFFGDENMSSVAFEKSDYKQTEGYKNYVDQCVNNMRQTRANFDEVVARQEIEEQIDGIVRVALAAKKAGYDIFDDASKRDVKDSKKRLLFSSLEPNSEYLTSNDISTECDKRKNFADIYDSIVKREEAMGVPQGKRFFDNVDNYFYLHKVLADKGLTQPCRECYVESMRKNLAPMADAFLRLVNETDVNNKANDQLYHQEGKDKGKKKSNNDKLRNNVLKTFAKHPEYNMTASDLTVEMLTTEYGLAQLRIQAPLIYEAFNSFYGQSKPKMPKSATPFRFGELTALLTDHNGKIKQSLVKKINSTGGFRLQSYSDFQIQNFTDVLQVIYEAGTLGLSGHAYTKVPAFLKATEGTNLKRNISIFMYKDGNEWKLDKNDSFPAESLKEIYDIVNADKSGNTGIIAVSQNTDMSCWIMANDYIAYGIPFHKSGLKMDTVRDTDVKTDDGRIVKGYSETIDHTKYQTEVYADTETKVKKGIDIYEFWDFDNKSNLPKNELIEKNVKEYIRQCEIAGYLPKFRNYIINNESVLNDVLRYSKELGFVEQNATIDDISFTYEGKYHSYRIPYGYYKFIGDFSMFTPNGKASPHETLSLNNYDFDKAERFFADVEGLRRNEILQQFANDGERQKYRDSDLTAEDLEKIVGQKRKEVVDEIVAPVQNSLSYEGEQPSSVGTPLQDLYLAPTKEDVSQMENTAQPVVEDTTVDAPTNGEDTNVPTNDVSENIAPAVDMDAPTTKTETPNPALYNKQDGENGWRKFYKGLRLSPSREALEDAIKYVNPELFSEIHYEIDTAIENDIAHQPLDNVFSVLEDKVRGDEYTPMQAAEVMSDWYESHGLKEEYEKWLTKHNIPRQRKMVATPTQDVAEEVEAPMPDEISPMTEEEAHALQDEKVEAHSATTLEAIQTELANVKELRSDAFANYEQKIAQKQAELNSKKNKDTKTANNLRMQIERLKRLRDSTDAEYSKRISNLETREKLVREGKPTTRQEHYNNIINDMKATFSSGGYDFDDVLSKAKNLSTFSTVDNTPQRVMEKALGYKEGQVLADLTVNKVAQNETEGIKWLNSFTDRKNGLLAQISKQYKIKPGSKESAAAQMYAEGFYVAENNDIVAYGDAELAADFPDENVRWNIKGLATDPRIRQIYDETLDAINKSRTRNAYPEIQKLDNYFLHFRAMDDTFSKLGIPFNPNDIKAKDLPTDLNGVTADLKPGQPYFASAMHRTGKRTSFDLLGGLERYLTSAKNQIYHIDDIQTLRALRNYIADTYGQANGLEGIDALTEEEAQERIEQVYGSHLSTFAKFLNEEANILAGKTALIDRGLEGVIGRRGMTFLDTVRKQTGSNMVGYNISSSLTNFIPIAQTLAKSSKFDFLKAFAQTTANKFGSIVGKGDNFAENSPVMIRRKGADRFHRTPFQKVGDAGYFLMGAVDNISTELIARTKFNELTRKGMSEQQAHLETDKWVSRLMGDRSLGQMPQLYNSKTLGFITQFQLEVRNQLDSQYYDTIQEAKVSNEDIENRLARNAKTAAKVTSTFVQLAVAQHLFGKAFESVAGYNPAFDIIEVLSTMFGFDDEEDSEDTVLDNLEQGFLELLEDLPYTSAFTGGGRIPMSSALPISELITGKDSYGNEKSRWDILGETLPYYALPGGYGQIKKTSQGLGMFSDEHPIAGSYTDSGNLRFPVEDTLGNRIQAGIFGQYANENAREYFDNDYAPLKEKQIQEFIDVELPIGDYWKYREGLSGLTKLEEKAEYINSLDIKDWQKNVLINNLANRKDPIDMTNYDDYGSFEEFDYASKNPDKYAFAKSVGGYSAYKTYSDELYDIKADKDSNGKTINGSRKEKVLQYINNLDADYETKLILFKSEYPSDDTYNQEIIEYINNRDDLTYQERIAIYTELGFTVKDGYIYW